MANGKEEVIDLDAEPVVDLDAQESAPIEDMFNVQLGPEEEGLYKALDSVRGGGLPVRGMTAGLIKGLKDQVVGLYDLGKLGVDVVSGDRSVADVYEAFKGLPEEEKMKIAGNMAGTAIPGGLALKAATSALLGQVAKKKSLEYQGKTYDTKAGLGEAAGETIFPLVLGKAAKTAKKLKEVIYPEVAAQNMAKLKGAFAERFIPYDRTENNKSFFRRLEEGQSTMSQSGILEEVNPSAKNPIKDLKDKIKTRLGSWAEERDSILKQADALGAESGLNRVSYDDLDIESSDIARDLFELKDSGVANIEASELENIISDVKRSFVDEYSILDPNTVVGGDVNSATRASLPKDYSIAEVKTKIDRAYDKLRQNRFFHVGKERGAAISNADAIRNEVETVFLDKFAKVARDAIAKKIDTIESVFPGQIVHGGGSLSASGEYSRLGQLYHNIKPYEDAVARMLDEFGASGGVSIPASGKESLGSLNPVKGGIDLLTGGDTKQAQRIVASAMGPENMITSAQAASRGLQGSSATPVFDAIQSYLAPAIPTAGSIGYNLDGSIMPSGASISGASFLNEALQPPPVPEEEMMASTPTPSPINSAISSALSDIAPRPVVAPRKSITGYDSEEDAGDGKVVLNKESDRADLRDIVFLSNMPNDKKRGVIKALIKGDPIDPNDLDEVATGRPRQVKRRVRGNIMRDLVRKRDARKLAEHGQISKAVERRKESDY